MASAARGGAASESGEITLVRYAGTHMKTARYAPGMCDIFRPAAARGWRTAIVLNRPPEDAAWLRPFEEIGTIVEYLPRPAGNFDLAAIRRARDLCRRLNVTVFHCDNMHTSPMLGAAWAGVPVRVWSKRSMQPAYEECRRPGWRDRLALSVRTTFSLADRVLPVSSAVAGELAGMGLSPNKITIFPNACEKPAMVTLDAAALRAERRFARDEQIVMTIGHAVPVKGWDRLLGAFAQIAAGFPAARLVFVGSIASAEERGHHAALLAQAQSLGIADRVRFTGFVADVFEYLAMADLFVLPSRSEGDSNALLQALVSGLPCVATRVGSAPDLIRDGETGILVDRDDAGALANGMQRVLGDEALRRAIARRVSEEKHAPTSAEYGEQLIAVYADLLAGVTPTTPRKHAGRWVTATGSGG